MTVYGVRVPIPQWENEVPQSIEIFEERLAVLEQEMHETDCDHYRNKSHIVEFAKLFFNLQRTRDHFFEADNCRESWGQWWVGKKAELQGRIQKVLDKIVHDYASVYDWDVMKLYVDYKEPRISRLKKLHDRQFCGDMDEKLLSIELLAKAAIEMHARRLASGEMISGYLWRISGEDGKFNYLLGTVDNASDKMLNSATVNYVKTICPIFLLPNIVYVSDSIHQVGGHFGKQMDEELLGWCGREQKGVIGLVEGKTAFSTIQRRVSVDDEERHSLSRQEARFKALLETPVTESQESSDLAIEMRDYFRYLRNPFLILSDLGEYFYGEGRQVDDYVMESLYIQKSQRGDERLALYAPAEKQLREQNGVYGVGILDALHSQEPPFCAAIPAVNACFSTGSVLHLIRMTSQYQIDKGVIEEGRIVWKPLPELPKEECLGDSVIKVDY